MISQIVHNVFSTLYCLYISKINVVNVIEQSACKICKTLFTIFTCESFQLVIWFMALCYTDGISNRNDRKGSERFSETDNSIQL